ncbi:MULTISPECIES: lytic transglycosylase domain-containing protein [Klebsiella]|uniref:lytic transglycosylase domain-containing protein n=1 Tax=Klebsiella TaxID=570 RepID=UPI0007DAD22D|nr:lytic transglycosylase domain-containing protein [Klebsiella oxytoca]HDH0217210.1 lytic transglycosylase domain-containing protein [Klebsiella pneumoniae]EGT0046071.1 lytic transglycosylase domain-containing protein [Klebsiella oxytoca]EJM1003151.1 lytic transglycosylase domain-containing protein [Klebsiella oxytoca]EKQ7239658.1 lytic transglycosylase domain-containing protein [Klebsiella oxytoca]ELR0729534.1 lytic transglycosylase domain-containing protein [Klebsiella oxytoca]
MIQGAASKGYIDQTQAQQLGQRWITDAATGSLKMMQPEQRLSALRNPQGITTFLPPDQRQAMIKDASYESLNTRLSQQQLQMYTGDAGMNVLAVPQETLLQAVFQQESGNRHRNADGSLVTSPAGAQGAGQIMPPTGKDPGFGVKPLQDDSEQENRRFTGDYLNAMLKRYSGNQILALAAYNAGPGKVDDWLKQIGDPRTGQVSNEQFAASIPFNETRNYVYSVSANAQRMGNVRSVIDSQEFKNLDGQQQAQIASRTVQIQDQVDSAYRVNIQQRITDDAARAQSGLNIENPVTEAEFIRSIPSSATPGERAQFYQQWNRYKDTLALQPVNNFVMQNSAVDGLAAVQALKPADNAADLQFKKQQYAQAQQNYQRIMDAREADPGGWLVQNDETTQKAFAAYTDNPDLMGDYVKNVIIQKKRLGIKSDAVIPKVQADALSQALLQSTPDNQSKLLDAIHKGTGGGAPYMATLKQIAVNAPSAAVAGVLMDKPSSLIAQENWINPDITISPSQASKTILAGSAARKGTKDTKGMSMPKENDMRLEFSNSVQDAFAGDAQGAAMAYEVAKDYYAGIMAQKGDYSGVLDNDVWKQAVNVSTGGVHDYNGMGYVLLPWGMSAEQFDKQVDQAWQTQVTGAGVKAPPGQYGLQSYGDSQYLVKLGAGYLLKSDGSPVILDLTQQRQRFIEGIPQ